MPTPHLPIRQDFVEVWFGVALGKGIRDLPHYAINSCARSREEAQHELDLVELSTRLPSGAGLLLSLHIAGAMPRGVKLVLGQLKPSPSVRWPRFFQAYKAASNTIVSVVGLEGYHCWEAGSPYITSSDLKIPPLFLHCMMNALEESSVEHVQRESPPRQRRRLSCPASRALPTLPPWTGTLTFTTPLHCRLRNTVILGSALEGNTSALNGEIGSTRPGGENLQPSAVGVRNEQTDGHEQGPAVSAEVGQEHVNSIQRSVQATGRVAENVDDTEESAAEIFRIFMSDVLQKGDMLPLPWKSRKPITDLSAGSGALHRRQRLWWLGMCYVASTVTGVPIHLIKEEHISQAVEYQGVDDVRSKLLGLKEAVKKWAIWSDTEKSPEQPCAPADTTSKKGPRKWIPKTQRAAMKEIFKSRGLREISYEDAVELAGQFGEETLEPAKVQQLFTNWAKKHRRALREATANQQTSDTAAEGQFLQESRLLSEVAVEAEHNRQPCDQMAKEPLPQTMVGGSATGEQSGRNDVHGSESTSAGRRHDQRNGKRRKGRPSSKSAT